MIFRRIVALSLLALSTVAAVPPAAAQGSQNPNVIFTPAPSLSASAQTTPAISLANGTQLRAYSLCTITIGGTFSAATFGMLGSADQSGTVYTPILIWPIATPASSATTQTAAAAGGVYQGSCGTLTHLKFVTSSTFTGTNITFLVTASPNAQASKGSSSGAPTTCASSNNYVCSNVANTFTATQTMPSLVTNAGGVQVPTGSGIQNSTGGTVVLNANPNIPVQLGLTGFSYAPTTGTSIAIELDYNTFFQPPSGSARFVGTLIDPVINGSSSGTSYAEVVAPITPSLIGGKVYATCWGSTTGANLAGLNCPATVGTDGVATFPAVVGPAAAPTGTCATIGQWVFSQDGHATFCPSNGGTWATKI